ncbi:sulfur reduction protein DsrP [Sulfolobus sp. S-194]|uniref:NrfD/PsrC family molybdoenzyme membrane anchor subunit n=1 Tax=Sulfolobus sp. S-194 TaxID=2512240 RepID=UPI001436FD5C|nr:NrfD/PsrC family molybdoenzyme membrane anchor subunit [Sulfolobus sp. S-194]QIW24035.1 sulfur reduction protein DsrP [Sulfolobus sp. S-194]
MNKKEITLIIWTAVFIVIGGGILFYGMSFNPFAWFGGNVTFTEPNNAPIPWGLLVIGYMFFGVIGTGVSTYNSLYEIFNKNHKERNPFEKVKLRNEWIALAVLIPGWIMVFASVFKPGEAVYIYLSFRDTSRIAWNGILYVLVGIGIIALILAIIGEKAERKDKKPILAYQLSKIGILIAGYAVTVELILDANLGSVFGYLSTWVFEFGSFMPLLFVVLSFYSGIGMISFVSPLYSWLKKESKNDPPSTQKQNVSSVIRENSMYKILARDGLLATIAVGFLTLWWMWITATNQETYPWAQLLISGGWSDVFWGGTVVVGILIPIILYAISYKIGNKITLFAAAIFSLLGMFAIVTIADVIPQAITWYYTISPVSPSNSNWVYEFRSVFNHGPLWSILPFGISYYDIIWFVGSVLLLLGVYTFGVLLLPLEEEEEVKHWIFK